ncbi:MAG: 50S ribosomal protein L22 [Candidatus Woykebacteria bacterium RIFCSPHIGHO2_01_FULL_39_12]|uniref:Large ribosomal subunit protein uL22 n=2 Tax=Candidatus Woykeibacteriota TaxID=1817899 RepID=A0A1G1WDI2_9BACT|nr:MAG: 50S ribosomal protein L22 [Candidatus Woykebacteria bacterium RBG_16_39_9b]OGY27155.1 MAG: 50S ribosomal protein L22 [Candidatus Woykebacteria bacterium RIFCSPHIGHO2_01_FULL_39_12]
MEVIAEAKNVKVSPKKARLVAATIRGKGATKALESLKFITKKPSIAISKVIKSAISNATHNYSLKEDNLVIKELTINEGQYWKRFRPRSRGLVSPILKRTSHIKVILEESN